MDNRTKKVGALVLATSMLFSTGCISKASAMSGETERYTVQKGDTLRGISREFYSYSHYYDELASYNHIDNPNKIYVGQELLIPDLSDLLDCCNSQTAEEKTYEIQKGDTLSSICKYYYGNTEYLWHLATYNNLENPNLIRAGRTLKIPSLETLKGIKPRDYSMYFNRKHHGEHGHHGDHHHNRKPNCTMHSNYIPGEAPLIETLENVEPVMIMELSKKGL